MAKDGFLAAALEGEASRGRPRSRRRPAILPAAPDLVQPGRAARRATAVRVCPAARRSAIVLGPSRTRVFPRKGATGCGSPRRSTRPSSPRPRRAAASARSSSPPSPSRRTRAGSRSRSRSGWPSVGLWDVDPLNLFRITWKNEPKEKGGLFNRGNWIEFPPELTGVQRPHRRPGRQVLPHRRPQGRRRLRLPRAAAGLRRVRPRRRTRRSGPRPATTAAAAPSTAPCSAARPSPSCPRGCRRERFEWLQRDRRRGHRHARAASRTSRRSTTSAGRSARTRPRLRRSSTSSRSSATRSGTTTMTGAIVEEVFGADPQAATAGWPPTSPPPARPAPSPPATTCSTRFPHVQGRRDRGAAVPDAAA